jgi:hypothetical protein
LGAAIMHKGFNGFKKRSIFISAILTCFLIVALSGCGIGKTGEPSIPVYTEPMISTDAPPTTPENTPTNTPKDVISVALENNVKYSKGPDIKTFVPLKESFIKYDFNVVLNGTKEEPISYLVQGQYDLNKDGTSDKIKILLVGSARVGNVQAYVDVNGIKKDFDMSYAMDGEVRIVDLDSTDKYLEIAIFDEGPSGDPHYIFYRYDGNNLYTVGGVNGIDDKALIDKKGNLISSGFLSRFSPAFYSAWYAIENNQFIEKNIDIKGYIDKDYTFAGGEAYFVPSEKVIDPSELPWNGVKTFPASKVKVIDISFYPKSRVLNFYFVEFPNGDKGMLYFWMGD